MLKLVDLVLAGKENVYETIHDIMPDVIVYGYDQKPFLMDKIGFNVKIVRAPAYKPDKIKTGKILKQLGHNEI